MSGAATVDNQKITFNWKAMVKPYQHSIRHTSIWQLFSTFVPFILFWYLMYLSLDVGYWLTLLLSVPTAGFLVRMFIIQHDCGHGSFFKSKKWNDRVGFVCGIFTLTPYYQWRKNHAVHHATAGDLGRRDVHDVYTMTVQEYREKSLKDKIAYRIYRNPIFLFLIVPMTLFVVLYRFPSPISRRKEKLNVIYNDIALVLIVLVLSLLIGFRPFLLVTLPALFIATTVGTWLFYVQHQFEETYWANSNEWDYAKAALEGSSYYKLPKMLQWFTGNIGFHHIHHLSPRIPNYLLEQCFQENPELQDVPTLTLASSFKTITLTLWDEEEKKLVGFKAVKNN